MNGCSILSETSNWLFAGSDEGGKTAATLMSLCTTCKDLGVDPFAYLRDVLDRVSTHPHRRTLKLLPELTEAGRKELESSPVRVRMRGVGKDLDLNQA